MSIIENKIQSRYYKIIKSMEKEDAQSEKGFNTFFECVLYVERKYKYFKELKFLEKIYTNLHVDDTNTFEKNVEEYLMHEYSKRLQDMVQDQNKEKQLLKLKDDVNKSYGHKCDKTIDKIVKNINYKLALIYQENQHTISENIDDPLFDEIVSFIVDNQMASASLLQRKFRLEYNRAARIIDALEEMGYIGPQNGVKPRNVYVNNENINQLRTEYKNTIKSVEKEKPLKYSYDSRTIEEKMLDYKINIEYNKIDLCKELKNTIITNSFDENEKIKVFETLVTYHSPESLRIFVTDFNKILFNEYRGIPHLLIPSITNMKKLEVVMNNLYTEMERRYELFINNRVKTYEQYTETVEKLNYIVVIIDECFDVIRNKELQGILMKLLLNGQRVGIKFIFFSSISKKNLNLKWLDDLATTYKKFNLTEIFPNISSNKKNCKE